jgi:hypothetical protein
MRLGSLGFLLAAFMLAAGAVQAAEPPPQAVAARRQIVLVNDAGSAVERFHIAPAGQDSEDVLGESILAPGERVTINLESGVCRYDLGAWFLNGGHTVRLSFDVCANPEVHLAALLREDALMSTPSGTGAAPPNAAPEPSYGILAMPDEVAAEPPQAPTAAAPPRLDRGIPICPGDVRCKKKK